MIRELENVLGTRAVLSFLDEQPGDVPQTYASIEKARRLFGYEPKTSLKKGLTEFARWLKTAAVAGC
jgi:UDP-glucuronate 4-epimerase